MTQPLNIALSINDGPLLKSVQGMLHNVPDAEVSWWNGVKPAESEPEIIFVDDNENEPIVLKLANLRRNYPQTAIFVISQNKSPEHIIEVMKAGGSEYLIAPLDKKLLFNAITETRLNGNNRDDDPPGDIYSFISSKGGLGSTCVAVNTAEAIALQMKESVALWDMSFQSGDSSVLLDIIPENTVIDICKNIHRLDVALLKSAMSSHENGIDLLCAPTRPEESDHIASNHIAKILNLINKLYKHVIIDCASMFINDCTIEAFKVSSKVFIVIDLSVPAIRNASRISELIQQMGIRNDQIEFVINRYVASGTLAIEEAERTLGKHIFWLIPNDFDSVISSINNGDPLVYSTPRCTLSKSIFEFIKKINNPEMYKNFRGIRRRRFLSHSYALI